MNLITASLCFSQTKNKIQRNIRNSIPLEVKWQDSVFIIKTKISSSTERVIEIIQENSDNSGEKRRDGLADTEYRRASFCPKSEVVMGTING